MSADLPRKAGDSPAISSPSEEAETRHEPDETVWRDSSIDLAQGLDVEEVAFDPLSGFFQVTRRI